MNQNCIGEGTRMSRTRVGSLVLLRFLFLIVVEISEFIPSLDLLSKR